MTLISSPKQCICPGDVVIYECTVQSVFGGATVFRAKPPSSFVSCTGIRSQEELILPHSQFIWSQHGVKKTCNNDTVISQILNTENGTYTSQLSITVTSELIGITIECVNDNGTSRHGVGSSTIPNTGILLCICTYVHTAYYLVLVVNSGYFDCAVFPRAPSIGTAEFRADQFIFSWSPVSSDCSTVHYSINASNCGSCPTTTNHTNVTCIDVPTSGGVCNFTTCLWRIL